LDPAIGPAPKQGNYTVGQSASTYEDNSEDRFRGPNRRRPGGPGLGVGARYGMRGWCPKGRKAEDGPIDRKYPLKETPSAAYVQRTEWNVRDSDATVLFSIEPTLTGGTKKTMDFARKHKKPRLHLCARDHAAADKLKALRWRASCGGPQRSRPAGE
jgi:hypothetical protein